MEEYEGEYCGDGVMRRNDVMMDGSQAVIRHEGRPVKDGVAYFGQVTLHMRCIWQFLFTQVVS